MASAASHQATENPLVLVVPHFSRGICRAFLEDQIGSFEGGIGDNGFVLAIENFFLPAGLPNVEGTAKNPEDAFAIELFALFGSVSGIVQMAGDGA